MIDKVKCDFSTRKQSDVPVIGTRKKLFVNGTRQMMYVSEVVVTYRKNIECDEPSDKRGHVISEFNGTVEYRRDVWI